LGFCIGLVNLVFLKILAKIISMSTMEKRVKRGVDEFKREKIKEFFRACGWWIGKVHQKAGATMRDDKGRLVHLFSYADAWDLMEMMKELLGDEERLKKVREML
jgi:hypothetical protein